MLVRMIGVVLAILFAGIPFVSSASPLQSHLDLSYLSNPQDDELQRLNIFRPKTKDKLPLLVWIGGGAWSYVDKDKETDIAKHFAQEGIVVAAIGHRLSPAIWHDTSKSEGVEHPAHIEDVAAAIHWLVENSEEFNIDTSRIFVGGFSSGAHLAALIVADPKYLSAHDIPHESIRGIIPIGGSYDILDYHRIFEEGSRPHLAQQHVEAVFGTNRDQMKGASPITFVENISTAILLISDSNTYNYTRLFEQALVDAGNSNMSVIHIRHLGHGPLWQHMSKAENSTYRDLIVSFVKNGLATFEPPK